MVTSPQTARRRPRWRPRSPGRSRTPWPASPTSSRSPRRSPRASSTTVIQFELGAEPAEGHRRRPLQGRPDRATCCRATSTRRSSSGWTSTTSRSSPTPSRRPAMSDGGPVLVHRQHHGPHPAGRSTGVGQVDRVGGVDREINVIVDPDRMAAQGVTARRSTTPWSPSTSTCPAAGPTSAAASRPCGCWARRPTSTRSANSRIPAPGGRFVQLSRRGRRRRRHGRGARLRRGSNDQPGGRLPGAQDQDASEVAVEDGVDATLKTLEKTYPGVTVHQDLLHGRRHPRQLLGHPAHPARRHGAGGAGGLAVPARLARHGDHRHRHAGVADPDLRLHERWPASASTWSPCWP